MTKTENVKKMKNVEDDPKRFSLLVFMASILSLGSLAWTTWSLLDFFKVDSLIIERLGNVSLIGLSAAVTMDIVWSATMYAEYKGAKLPYIHKRGKDDERTINVLPAVGWIEVLFVAALLGVHGSSVGGGAAAFAAVLPVFTKLTWILALNDLRDPSELTEDQKLEIAEERREARLAKEKSDASAERHEADLEAQRRKNEADLEDAKSAAAKKRIELESDFELEKAKAEGEANIKMMRNALNARIQIQALQGRNEVELERLDAEQEFRLRAPIGFNVIQGEVSRPQITSGSSPLNETFMGLTDAEQRRAELAARYYAADHREGGVTKSAFCKANNINPPRLSEATAAFPVEWFIENDLADWRVES